MDLPVVICICLLLAVVCVIIFYASWRVWRTRRMRRRQEDALEQAKYKELGDAKLLNKEYTQAIDNYNRALEVHTVCPDIDLIFNRGLAFYQLRCYSTALADIHTVIARNPMHEECQYLKVKALWGLRQYKEALDYTQNSLPTHILETPLFQSIHERCKLIIEQSEGRFDINDIRGLQGSKDMVGEYTAPMEIVAIPGKGRGVVAKSDIKMGDLVLCEKAFAFVTEEDARKHYASWDEFPIRGTQHYLVSSICSKLSFEPSLREWLFDLYAGPSVGIPLNFKTKTTEVDEEDAAITSKIVAFNGFRDLISTKHSKSKTNTVGLWMLVSHFNCCCVDATAHFVIQNDYIFVRAAQDIYQGREITISYLLADDPNRRIAIKEVWQFNCNCKLCSFEEAEHPDVQHEIQQTLKLIQTDLDSDSSSLDTQTSRVWKIISLRQSMPSVNMALLHPAIRTLCRQLSKNAQTIPTVIKFLEYIHEVAETSIYDGRSVILAVDLIDLFISLADKKNALKWVKILKTDLVRMHGSVLAVKLFYNEYDVKLRAALEIDFYSKED